MEFALHSKSNGCAMADICCYICIFAIHGGLSSFFIWGDLYWRRYIKHSTLGRNTQRSKAIKELFNYPPSYEFLISRNEGRRKIR